MKRTRLSLIFCVLLILSLIATAHAKASLPYGFKGLIWGQSLNDFPEKKIMKDISTSLGDKILEKDESAYKRLNGDNSIGGVDSVDITYIFWRGKFKAVTAYTQGSDKFDQLADSTQKKFGRPTYVEKNQYCNRITWINPKAEIVITMAGDDNVVHFYMKSLAIEKEKKRWDKVNKQTTYTW